MVSDSFKRSIGLPSLVLAFILFLLPAASLAQEKNLVYGVLVNDFDYTEPETKTESGSVVNSVLQAIAGSTKSDQHAELAPPINAEIRNAITDVRRLATVTNPEDAAYNVSGTITSITTESSSETVKKKDKKGKEYTETYYTHLVNASISLTLTDVATGQQWTNTFTGKGSGSTQEDAFEYVKNNLYKSVKNYCNNLFPLEAQILEGAKEKKEKMQEVYIDLGSNHGVEKGLHFSVYYTSVIAGKEARKTLGKLKIVEVLGDELSRCKVEKGSKEIKTAIDEGVVLSITSMD